MMTGQRIDNPKRVVVAVEWPDGRQSVWEISSPFGGSASWTMTGMRGSETTARVSVAVDGVFHRLTKDAVSIEVERRMAETAREMHRQSLEQREELGP